MMKEEMGGEWGGREGGREGGRKEGGKEGRDGEAFWGRWGGGDDSMQACEMGRGEETNLDGFLPKLVDKGRVGTEIHQAPDCLVVAIVRGAVDGRVQILAPANVHVAPKVLDLHHRERVGGGSRGCKLGRQSGVEKGMLAIAIEQMPLMRECLDLGWNV